MTVKKAWKAFTHTLKGIWKTIFYTFSAVTLYAFIAFCIHIAMSTCGASGKAIDITLIVYSCIVAAYVIGKTYYIISSWLKKHSHHDVDDLNALNAQRVNHTDAPTTTQDDVISQKPTTPATPTRLHTKTPLFSISKKQAPIEPVKAGNFRW